MTNGKGYPYAPDKLFQAIGVTFNGVLMNSMNKGSFMPLVSPLENETDTLTYRKKFILIRFINEALPKKTPLSIETALNGESWETINVMIKHMTSCRQCFT